MDHDAAKKGSGPISLPDLAFPVVGVHEWGQTPVGSRGHDDAESWRSIERCAPARGHHRANRSRAMHLLRPTPALTLQRRLLVAGAVFDLTFAVAMLLF